MNSYANVGWAHVELLLSTCLDKENPSNIKNLLTKVHHL
jgi:hypothetical protein